MRASVSNSNRDREMDRNKRCLLNTYLTFLDLRFATFLQNLFVFHSKCIFWFIANWFKMWSSGDVTCTDSKVFADKHIIWNTLHWFKFCNRCNRCKLWVTPSCLIVTEWTLAVWKSLGKAWTALLIFARLSFSQIKSWVSTLLCYISW